jgi:hypothetical protein
MKTIHPAALDEITDTTVKSIHNEVEWYVPLGDEKTLMITILNVDLGPDIPCWAVETGLASNLISQMISLRALVGSTQSSE